MTKRIFRSILFTAMAAVVFVSVFVLITLYKINETDTLARLKTRAAYVATLIGQENGQIERLERVLTDDRITYIGEDGTVLYDNMGDAPRMRNHADRPEVVSALKTGVGTSTRYSDTLYQKIIYYAVRVGGGNVLRLASTQNSALGMVRIMLPVLGIIVLAVALLSFINARFLSKQITAPINKLNLAAPFENDIYDELSPLLLLIERQNLEIQNKILEITEKQRSFNAVTENMREGLVLLSNKGIILSMNTSAASIFDADPEKSIGRHILSVVRSVSIQEVFDGAMKGENPEALLAVNGRYFQLLGNLVSTTDKTLGVVIMALDVTEKQNAEYSRREFTANVTHELKTPLTSILGFAEIMKDGITKPEDMQGFAGRIHDEAERLLTLINDILELSHLDERTTLPNTEEIDLFVLASDVLDRLAPMAERAGINTSVQGQHISVIGNKKILDEMLYNLCDNAIKYNKIEGTVEVTIGLKDGKPTVTVRDTGIGIPPRHQGRIFERFYRVDSNESKAISGTGLGLAIVKHGAKLHDATIRMKSIERMGTTFEVTFPHSSEAVPS